VTVLFDVTLRCFDTVMGREVHVAMRHVGVVGCLFVMTGGVVLCRFPMVLRRVFVVLRRLGVVLRRFLRHGQVLRRAMDANRSVP
jgi:hypothetical protein